MQYWYCDYENSLLPSILELYWSFIWLFSVVNTLPFFFFLDCSVMCLFLIFTKIQTHIAKIFPKFSSTSENLFWRCQFSSSILLLQCRQAALEIKYTTIILTISFTVSSPLFVTLPLPFSWSTSFQWNRSSNQFLGEK